MPKPQSPRIASARPRRPPTWASKVIGFWKDVGPGMSSSDAIHATLRRAIVEGVLPPGERLAENQLAAIFKRSRTPIREATVRLESERLAEYLPRQGLVVATIGRDEILEVYAVRSVLDGLAARLAAEGMPTAEYDHLVWLNAHLRTAAEAGDYENVLHLNIEFHEAICRASRNAVLLQYLKQINDRVGRFRGSVLSYPGRAVEAVAEHDALLHAIAQRDPDEAERIARAHMVRAMQLRIAMQQLSFVQSKPASPTGDPNAASDIGE